MNDGSLRVVTEMVTTSDYQESPMIDVQHLSKAFNGQLAVDDLTFTVPRGTVTGFLGPNGAGKTTTLRMLLGLATPTAGTARIDGRHYANLVDPRRQVGAFLEASGFHPGRSGRNHLRIIQRAARLDADRVDLVLDLVGLSDAATSKVGTYSLGMRQRLGLASAMLGDPRVIILDEPANGLDPEGIRWLRGLFRGWASEGRTVLISSHVLAEVAQTVDHVVIIGRGQLRWQGRVDQLVADQGGGSLEDAFIALTRNDRLETAR